MPPVAETEDVAAVCVIDIKTGDAVPLDTTIVPVLWLPVFSEILKVNEPSPIPAPLLIVIQSPVFETDH